MSGIHHVTAISGKAARNLNFYTQVIGLRFVKKTVNFDDPGTYHFSFKSRPSDSTGSSTAKPGLSVAISNRMPPGSRK
jgi:catechol 2,3-dioxygenase-like lactoylglutathione lyase family enzyme